MSDLLGQFLVWLLQLNPHMAPLITVLAMMGTARAVFKVTMTALKDVVKVTETSYDDDLLASFEKSKTYTVIAYLLDWFASIKLPSKK